MAPRAAQWLLPVLAVATHAASNNTVVAGNVRVTVHTPHLLRLEWSATGTFDDRPTLAFVNRGVGAPFSYTTAGGGLSLNTSALSLKCSGARFGGGSLSIMYTPRAGSPRAVWTPNGSDTLQCGTAAGQDRVDCGVPAPNATTCTAAGCCFDPNINGTNCACMRARRSDRAGGESRCYISFCT